MTGSGSRWPAVAASFLTAALVMLGLDLLFLGVVAEDFYNRALGNLRSPQVYRPAALLFYAFYVASIVVAAVLPARSAKHAARRGAALGLFGYGVFELTNWAVLAGWPGHLVPVDIAWGVFLTGLVALSSRIVFERLQDGAG